MSSAFTYTSTAVDLREGAGRLPDGTPLFLDANANYIKVGDLVGLALGSPRRSLHTAGHSEMGIVMELITEDPLLSLGYDVRIVKVKWLRSGVCCGYPNDLVVIAK
tara:strand:+ start:477 stop:794 length:318 start_codon:yes stop_codon:yes gene_type:complete